MSPSLLCKHRAAPLSALSPALEAKVEELYKKHKLVLFVYSAMASVIGYTLQYMCSVANLYNNLPFETLSS